MRTALVPFLMLLVVGCGSEPQARPSADLTQRPPSGPQPSVVRAPLELAARDLLPPAVTVPPVGTDVHRCFGPFNRPTPCVTMLARGGGRRLADRSRAFQRAARSRGWRLVKAETHDAGSASLTFRRGGLEAIVMLAPAAPDAIVKVGPRTRIASEEAAFAAAARAACDRFGVAIEHIDRSLPRETGLRRVRAVSRALVVDIERLTPPTALRGRHRSLLAALRSFEGALVPLRPRALEEAAKRVDRAAQAAGVPGCIAKA